MQDSHSGGSDIPSNLSSPACASFQGNGQQPPTCILRVQCQGHLQAFQAGIAHRSSHSLPPTPLMRLKPVFLPLCSPAPPHPRFNPTPCLLQMSRIPASLWPWRGYPLQAPHSREIQRPWRHKRLPGQDSTQDFPPQPIQSAPPFSHQGKPKTFISKPEESQREMVRAGLGFLFNMC